jgi:tRNA wybutosine-synthesizing protein 3
VLLEAAIGSAVLISAAKKHIANRYTFEKSKDGKVVQDWDEILDLLRIINSSEKYYTTSSCAGRLQLIALPKLGDKLMSVVVAKWHQPIKMSDLKRALDKWDGKHMLFLMMQSPVVHVVCHDLDCASRLRNLADGAGFKYSTIRSIHTSETDHGPEQSITIEILSTERMDMPIGNDGKLFVSDEHLQFLLDLSMQALDRARTKLARLEETLKEKL